jgi:hypothetical protein
VTLDLKKGAENVCDALKYFLAGNLPGVITTLNNATSSELIAYYKGPYTFDGSKKISIDVNQSGSPIEVTPSNATLTATQLAAELNADGTFSATLTADTTQQGNYLRIYKTTRGVSGSLEVQDETGNAVLGWATNYTDNYNPLREFGEIEVQYENIAPLAYPALHLLCEGYNDSDTGELRTYDIRIKIYNNCAPSPTWANVMYKQLERYSKLINDLLWPMATGSRSLYGQVNDISLNNATFGKTVEVPLNGTSAGFRAWVEFTTSILVQEA